MRLLPILLLGTVPTTWAAALKPTRTIKPRQDDNGVECYATDDNYHGAGGVRRMCVSAAMDIVAELDATMRYGRLELPSGAPGTDQQTWSMDKKVDKCHVTISAADRNEATTYMGMDLSQGLSDIMTLVNTCVDGRFRLGDDGSWAIFVGVENHVGRRENDASGSLQKLEGDRSDIRPLIDEGASRLAKRDPWSRRERPMATFGVAQLYRLVRSAASVFSSWINVLPMDVADWEAAETLANHLYAEIAAKTSDADGRVSAIKGSDYKVIVEMVGFNDWGSALNSLPELSDVIGSAFDKMAETNQVEASFDLVISEPAGPNSWQGGFGGLLEFGEYFTIEIMRATM